MCIFMEVELMQLMIRGEAMEYVYLQSETLGGSREYVILT
jgi:hypothetical protein